MQISELYFPHLVADREARFMQELERERVVRERLESAPAPRRGIRRSQPERTPTAARPLTPWAYRSYRAVVRDGQRQAPQPQLRVPPAAPC